MIRGTLVGVNTEIPTLELWLIRHGETDWNRGRRVQGHSESVLTERGQEQAKQLAQRLAGTDFDRIYCSDLGRAQKTAMLAFPGRRFELDTRLRELAGGIFEGKTVEEMTPAERELRKKVVKGDIHVRPEGGESYADLMLRVQEWLAELPASGRVACVTHGGVIHTALRVALNQLDDWSSGPKLATDNTSITELWFSAGTTVIRRMNDHAHLEHSAVAAS